MNITFNALTLAPALTPMLAAVLALAVDAVLPKRPVLSWGIAAVGLLAGLVPLVQQFLAGQLQSRTLCTSSGVCYWMVDRAGMGLQAVALVSAVFVVVLAAVEQHTAARRQHGLTRAVMVLAATAGCVAVVAAQDLASWLVMVELATIPGIVLAALTTGPKAAHGALTLLTTAVLSFAVLALGASLWFAATGSVMLDGQAFTQAAHHPTQRPLLVVGTMLMLAGVGFKLSLAPFHAWTPTTFTGSGAWVSAFLATTSKVGALGAMLVLLRAAGALGPSALMPLGLAAVISMTVGNVMALRAEGLLRFLAWSTVSQAGWVVVPMTVVGGASVSAAACYLALYVLGTLAVFVALAAFEAADARAPLPGGPNRDIPAASLAGTFRTHPILAGTMTLGLLSLAGVPPTLVGVVAKIVALRPAVGEGLWWVVIIAILNAMLGLAVYLRWIIAMTKPSDDTPAHPSMPMTSWVYTALAVVVSAAIIVTSVAPNLLIGLF